MNGKGRRLKGINFERKIASVFRKIFPKSCRNYENLPGAELGHDVVAGHFKIQCKRGRGYAPTNKIFEVQSSKGIPLLISKADNKPEMVTINLEAFLEMVRKCKIYDEMKFIRGELNGSNTSTRTTEEGVSI